MEEKIYNEQLHQELEQLEALILKEREVIKFNYAWDNIEPMTLKEIWDILSISSEKARQIKQKGFGRIRTSK